MHDYHSQNFNHASSILTPKEPYNTSHGSYLSYSPISQNKSKIIKEAHPTDRPKSNKTRPTENLNQASQRHIDALNGTMQRLLMDKNTNNLAGSFYNVGPKAHNREKSSLVNMFKMRESDLAKEVPKDSPGRRVVKQTHTQRESKMKDDKAMMFEIIPIKSYKKDDVDFKTGELTQRPTSRQKSSLYAERGESPSKNIHSNNIVPQKYLQNSPEKGKPKSSRNLVERFPSHSEIKTKRAYKPVEIEHDRQTHASSLYHSRVSPAKQHESVKPYEFIQIDNKGYKSAYRGFEIDSQSQLIDRNDGLALKKLHKRGLSIDQAMQYGIAEKAMTSRREKAAKYSRDENYSVALSPNEKKSSASRQEYAQQQQEQPQQQVVVVNNEAEQIKYFEKLLHIDKMTFDFEKQMIMRREKKLNAQVTPISSTMNTKQTLHSRTRSMEDHGSLFQTKSSSVWNTKRTGIEEGQYETAEIGN